MTTHTSILKRTVIALASGAMLLAPLSAAQAYEGRGQHRAQPAPRYSAPAPHHRPAPQERHRSHRGGDRFGAAILGIGAVIVGAAIAEAARESRRDDRDED